MAADSTSTPQEQGFKCLSCLISKEDVQYIDKSYIVQLEKYNEMRVRTEQAIHTNEDAAFDVARWKDDVRNMVMRVRSKYVSFIDEFALQLKRNIMDIGEHAVMKEYADEDRDQERRVKVLKEKHLEISGIIDSVESTPRHQKAQAVRTVSERMTELDREMTLCWQQIILQRQKVNEAIGQALPLENLSTQIYGQFFKHIQQKVRLISEKPAYTPKSKMTPEQVFQEAEESKGQSLSISDSPIKATQIERNVERRAQTDSQTKRTNVIDNMVKTNVLRETLRAGGSSASIQDQTSQNAELYLLKQDTQDMQMLDFEKKLFTKLTITQRFPMQSKSLQTPSGDIFVVGGFNRSGKSNELEVLRDCFRVNKKLQVIPQEKMEIARFGSPLVLVHDRFVLAMGGFTTPNEQTGQCEAFDTVANRWFRIAELPFAVANTTAVVMNNQTVYLMPGKQTKSKTPPFLMICMLDCGQASMFRADPTSRDYGLPIAQQNWIVIEVANQDFIRAGPNAALQLSQNEMMIFGGETTKTFIFNTNNVDKTSMRATLQPAQVNLERKARFGFCSDFVGHKFGGFYYAIDAADQVIHSLDMTTQQWSSQAIGDFIALQ